MRFLISAIAAISLSGIAAAETAADSDGTPVPVCSQMPDSAAFGSMSRDQLMQVCRAIGLLDGVRVKDIRDFALGAQILRHEGYADSPENTVKQLVQIIRQRGLYNQPDKWRGTIDIVLKAYLAFNGVVEPLDIIGILSALGERAKILSDDGFTRIIVVYKLRKQSGE